MADKIGLMGAQEIQERLKVSRQRTYTLIKRKGFPEPYVTLAMGSVWLTDDVEAWIADNRPHLNADETEA